MSSRNAEGRGRSYTLPIVLLALALRLAVIGVTAAGHAHGGLAPWFFSQTTELGRLAESLRTGHGLSSPFGGDTGPSAFLSPGYPALVAAVFAIFGPYSQASAIAMMVLQALFAAATVLVLIKWTQRIFGTRAATVAGILLAISPPALFLPTLCWETSLSVLLATTIVWLAILCADRPTYRMWLLAGLLAAFSLTVNPSLLPILVGCLGWAIFQSRRTHLRAPALGILLCLLLSTPWPVRNYRDFHTFIPLRSNMGYELWQGNRLGSDGFFEPLLHPNTSTQEFALYQSSGEVAYMRQKFIASREIIRQDTLRFLLLTCKRIAYFWTGVARRSAALVIGWITLTSLLGLAGLTRLWRHSRQFATLLLLPLLLFPLPYYITHPDSRFRLVLDPILIALTAALFTRRSPAGD